MKGPSLRLQAGGVGGWGIGVGAPMAGWSGLVGEGIRGGTPRPRRIRPSKPAQSAQARWMAGAAAVTPTETSRRNSTLFGR